LWWGRSSYKYERKVRGAITTIMSLTDSVSAISSKVVKTMPMVLKLIRKVSEVDIHLKIINKNILLLIKAIKKKLYKDNPLENEARLESNLAHLKYYREKLKQLKVSLKKSGSGLNNEGVKRKSLKLIWKDVESAFVTRIRSGIILNLKIKDPKSFFDYAYRSFACKIKKSVKEFGLIKVNAVLSANFVKPQSSELDIKNFPTKNDVIDINTNLKEWYTEKISSKLLKKLEEFQERDSGWALLEIISLKLNINKYNPLSGGISTYVKLPDFIRKKQGVINVENKDEYCFLWAIVSALHPVDRHAQRVSKYPHFSRVLKYDGLKFPMSVKDIPKFEKMNNLAINVYTVVKKQVLPICLSNLQSPTAKCINLLMIRSYENVELYHYTWMKNMSRLFKSQMTKHKRQTFICNRCLNHFTTEPML
jgi:hypothetical protein